ncbi:hypothetical protein [Sorangium sp. So ce887]|uniref:hypothetical protein n=1 Tax=Sorangium sp. So ce887 TaxID=3133324 RepID=UPI003F5F3DDC
MNHRQQRWPLLLSALATSERRAQLLWLSALALVFFIGRASAGCGGAKHAPVSQPRLPPDSRVASDTPDAEATEVAGGGPRADAIAPDAGRRDHDGSLRALYRILPRRSVAPAMGNSVGVTHDGRRLWLLHRDDSRPI